MLLKKIKSLIREVCYRYPKYSPEKIISQVEKYEIVSFDIFDTLVKRNLNNPKDIFYLVANKLFNDENEKQLFIKRRCNAESKARKFFNVEEVNLKQIVECLGEEYKNIRQEIIEAEQELEYEYCYANPMIKSVYDWCLNNNKKIIIVSDMYLNEDIIKRILQKCGYRINHNIYISSKIGLTKSTGNIYSYIIKDLQVSPKKIIHIGDSLKGDYINAKKNKIQSIRIATNPIRTKFIKTSFYKKNDIWYEIKNILSGHLIGNESLYYLFGLEVLSPLLIGFSLWLHNEIIKKRTEKVYFLARDGFLLQKAFLEIFQENNLKYEYLYVSRKALRRPVLYIIKNYSEFINYIPSNKFFSKNNFYKLFNLTENEFSYWSEAGFDKDEIIYTNNLLKNKKMKLFFKLIKNSPLTKKSYDDYKMYLKRKLFFGNVCIIDIGWAGTIQKSLEKICHEASINGYYVGLTKVAEQTIDGLGYISSKLNPQIATAGLFEYPFLANEGSLKSVTVNENCEVKINLCKYEYCNDQENLSHIQDMQKGALDGIRILKMMPNVNKLIDSTISYRGLQNVTKSPTLKEAILFGNMNFYDEISLPLAKPKSLFSYFLSPKSFIKDFSESGWKVGFLKRLFKIPFLYGNFLDYIRNK